jgi:hypothetical protein
LSCRRAHSSADMCFNYFSEVVNLVHEVGYGP